jgi:hypothetical protein
MPKPRLCSELDVERMHLGELLNSCLRYSEDIETCSDIFEIYTYMGALRDDCYYGQLELTCSR